MTDPSLDTVLRVLEILSIIGGGGMVFYRLGRTTSRVEEMMKNQADEISELKGEVKILGRVLTDVAVQKERLDSHDKRFDMLDNRYDELRHGEGFVYPLMAHPKAQT